VRFLLDQNISPLVAEPLGRAGHDVVHARDLDLSRAPDEVVLSAAAEDRRVLVSSDTDFGELLARADLSAPSLLLLRRQTQRRAADLAALILLNLDAVASDLERGAVVVFDGDRLRIRRLPIGSDAGAPEDTEG
jgi:predicted nuclease of predicted toxin-antitoxin system